MLPKTSVTVTHFGMTNDTYLTNSVKGGYRKERGVINIHVNLSGLDQHMLQGYKWQEFLHCDENKEQLLELIWTYFTTSTSQTEFSFPVTVTVKQDTYTISPEKIVSSYKCNHEDADTRLIFNALQSTTDVVVVSKDTAVLTLMIWAYSDPNSLKQCIKRAHYQTFKWVHCKEKTIAAINFESNGWPWCSDEENVKSVWFVNSQLPPSCDKKRKRGNINASTLKKSKCQRFEPNLFISNVIANALQISESDVEESDSLHGKKLMDLL